MVGQVSFGHFVTSIGINSSQTDLPTILNPTVLANHTEKAAEFKKLHDCVVPYS